MVHVSGDHFLGCPSLNPKHPDIQPEMNIGDNHSAHIYSSHSHGWLTGTLP